MTHHGLVIVFTGDGKGKTSAAMGIALRAAGHDMHVSVVQFIKTGKGSGEVRSAERLAPHVDFVSLGKGFVRLEGDGSTMDEHREAAREALEIARQQVASGYWDVVVLDEINTAADLGLIATADILSLIGSRNPKLHLVLTGRNADPAIIDAADLVTEMRLVKHPYDRNVPAQRGIDF